MRDIKGVQSVEDAMSMVNDAKSALSFQKRYAELGEEPPASAQCPFLPKKLGSATEQLQQGVAECPLMNRFAWLFQPEQKGIKAALLGSLLIGTLALVRHRNNR